jgi:hypothetical protein
MLFIKINWTIEPEKKSVSFFYSIFAQILGLSIKIFVKRRIIYDYDI